MRKFKFTMIGTKNRNAAVMACLGFLIFGTVSCGEDPPPVAPNVAKAPSAPVPKTQAANPMVDEEEKPEEVVVKRFRPVRDPFKSILENKQVKVGPSGGITHPLQQFSIGQLKLLGIIWGIAAPVALVSTPTDDEYIVKTGTPVGTGDGKVVAILPDRVVIVERYYDYRGQLQTEKYEMVLTNEGN